MFLFPYERRLDTLHLNILTLRDNTLAHLHPLPDGDKPTLPNGSCGDESSPTQHLDKKSLPRSTKSPVHPTSRVSRCLSAVCWRVNGKTHLLAPTESLLPTIQSPQTKAKCGDTKERRRRESGAVDVVGRRQLQYKSFFNYSRDLG